MSIPAGTKFIGIAADVDTYERKSAQANSPSNVYTIEEIQTLVKTPSVQSVVSSATVTPVYGNDMVVITAQAAALALANPTGTWPQGKDMMIRIKDNGTARAITFDTKYRAIGVTLPTTTVINKTTYVGVIYNATDDKFDVIGVTTEA
jgi:hypothetical protein